MSLPANQPPEKMYWNGLRYGDLWAQFSWFPMGGSVTYVRGDIVDSLSIDLELSRAMLKKLEAEIE